MSVAAKRSRRQPERLADTMGVGAPPPPLTQRWGKLCRATFVRRGSRGKVGFGRTQRFAKKNYGGGIRDGLPFPLRCSNGSEVSLYFSRQGAVAGVGLFAAEPIAACQTLGFFTGQKIDAAEARSRRAASAKCILQFVDLNGAPVYLDGSRGCTSPFGRINSSKGSRREANVEFVCVGEQQTVQTLSAIARDEEFLADYCWKGRLR